MYRMNPIPYFVDQKSWLLYIGKKNKTKFILFHHSILFQNGYSNIEIVDNETALKFKRFRIYNE